MFSNLYSPRSFPFYLLLTCTAYGAPSTGRDRTDGSTTALYDRGTFQDPSVNVRPKYRHWVPDAYIEDSVINFEIQQFEETGMGGFELICYQLYGDPTPSVYGYQVVDWGQYGFGSTAWKEKFAVYASAAQKYGLNMDFALGPNQGAGVPVQDPSAAGLSTGLELGKTKIRTGDTFSGQAPPPNLNYNPTFNLYWEWPLTQASPATLIGASAGRVVRVAGENTFLDENSMIDLTEKIVNGTITFTAPGNVTADWYVFSYWQRRTGQLEARGGLHGRDPSLPASGGSYIVDHFSTTGAKLSTNFMDQQVLSSGAFDKSSMYAWEDSIEAGASLFWTDTMIQDFEKRRGYSPLKFIPLYFRNYPGDYLYFNSSDNGVRYMNDYYQTLTDLYLDYSRVFKDWAHERGFQYSNQPAYNLPMDMAAAAAIADAPECESLAFSDNVDKFRQFAGGVNMANARIMSSECGARDNTSYSYTWPQIMYDVRTNWAGGVNQLVFHGSPYAGNYPNTTWPGWTSFYYDYSGQHNNRQPAWAYYRPIMDYIARTQFVLQSGSPKIDLAMYRQIYNGFLNVLWSDTGLANAGYTYNYVSPMNFDLPSGKVTNQRLADDGPGYKAIIIDNYSSLTVAAADHLTDYANAGLPVIFIGTVPSHTPGLNVTGDAYVKAAVQALLKQTSVKHVSSQAAVVDELESLNIRPDCASSFVCLRRNVNEDAANYFWVYNPGPAGTQQVTLLTTGTPFLLDPWSGKVTRIAEYSVTSSSLSFSLSLAESATAVIAIGNPDLFKVPGAASKHVVPSGFKGNVSNKDDTTLFAKSFQVGTQSISFSDNSSTTVSINVTQPRQTLDKWHLRIESWGPPADITDGTTHSTAILEYDITSVVPWKEIDPALVHVSGIGYYNTTFPWSGSSTDGLILTTGPIFHTISIKLNGQNVTAMELYDPWVDITKYLQQGNNVLEIATASTLQNVLLGLSFNPETSGLGANPPYSTRIGTEQEYGLQGPVVLMPYGIAEVKVA